MSYATRCCFKLLFVPALAGCAVFASKEQGPAMEKSVRLHYLEIVTPDVVGTCRTFEATHGVAFGEPIPELGNARTTELQGGWFVGVRAPMREDESPVVRPYVLVDDIEAAVTAAREAGCEIALPPTEIPARGKCAIYIRGGIQHGLWE